MIKFFETDNPLEAHVIRGLLQARNIAATVTGEDMAMAPSVVWIDEPDAEAAVFALHAANEAGSVPKSPWLCPACGVSIEPQFSACWRCGASASITTTATWSLVPNNRWQMLSFRPTGEILLSCHFTEILPAGRNAPEFVKRTTRENPST